ncbi:MinD/ParA family protein [Jutongia sp.]|uniref:MinD/ParA family protein n=1 Tax=Jutongia sp. TaxID=2944204 RepID=UPI00033D87C5|nr:MinD/ParA family protein [Clostridium sp.]CDE69104.1 site-determining protein [Clostridium sp. CAG:277]
MDQAEQLRNIVKQQNKKQRSARVITVTSGKGGVGKSNVSVNLAIQMSRLGKRAVILDADFGLANIEVMLGMRPQYNLADMMFRGKDVKDIICTGPEDIGFISGGSGLREMTNLNKDQILSLVRTMYELDHYADVVIIDTGAGISDTVIELVASSSEVLLVATPEPTSITDAYALLKTLHRHDGFEAGSTSIKMIGNRIQSYEEGKELYLKLNTVVNKFLGMEMEYLGAIPYDECLPRAVMQQQPVSLAYPDAPSARAMLELAMVLEDEKKEIEPMDTAHGLAGLFTKIFKHQFRSK